MFHVFRQTPVQPSDYKLSNAKIAEINAHDQLVSLMIFDKEIPFIQFTEIQEYLNKEYKYKIEPELKSWTNSGNEIISLAKDNKIYLAEVRYDPRSKQIFPPIR